MLEHGQQVCHGLAGVLPVREGVDDRNGGVLGQFLQVLMPEDAGHDAVHVARQHSRYVRHWFPGSEPNLFAAQVYRKAPELGHADLKTHLGSQRRLFEQQRHRLASQRRVVTRALSLRGQRNKARSLRGCQVGNRDEIALICHLFRPQTDVTRILLALQASRVDR